MLASELEGDSSRSPVSMGATQFERHRLYFRRHLMRAMCRPRRPIAEALQAVALIARQPAVHRLPTDAPLARDLAHRPTVSNYRQNRLYLCSVWNWGSVMTSGRVLKKEPASLFGHGMSWWSPLPMRSSPRPTADSLVQIWITNSDRCASSSPHDS